MGSWQTKGPFRICLDFGRRPCRLKNRVFLESLGPPKSKAPYLFWKIWCATSEIISRSLCVFRLSCFWPTLGGSISSSRPCRLKSRVLLDFFTSKMFKMFNFFARFDANQFFRKLVGANFGQFFEKVPNFGLTKCMLTSTKPDISFPTIFDFSVCMAWVRK